MKRIRFFSTGMSRSSIKSIVLLLLGFSATTQAQTLCVFDLLGAQGDSYAFMKDYALASRAQGVSLRLVVSKDEQELIQQYQKGSCDALSVTDFSSRRFNGFVSTLNALGAIPDYTAARAALSLVASDKFAAEMVQDGHEVGGIWPLGLVYLMTNDLKKTGRLADMPGKRWGFMGTDPMQRRLVERIGAVPEPLSLSSFGNLWNAGKLDVLPAPAMAFKGLELSQGLAQKGAVLHFPILLVSQTVILQPKAFPAGFGRFSRQWFGRQLPRTLQVAQRYEKDIPARYWQPVEAGDQQGYSALLREMRLNLTKEGVYNRKMTQVLKKIRCHLQPQAMECSKDD